MSTTRKSIKTESRSAIGGWTGRGRKWGVMMLMGMRFIGGGEIIVWYVNYISIF